MAIGFRAASGLSNRGSSTTAALTVTLPAGTALNDLLLMVATSFQSGSGGVGINTPSGWTLIATKTNWVTDYLSAVFYKVAGSSEPAPSVTTGSAAWLDAITVGFTGVDTTTPRDVNGVWGAASTAASVTVPSVTTLTANAWWISIGADDQTSMNAASVPSGWTQRALVTGDTGKSVVSSVPVAAAGATSATSYSKNSSVSHHVELGMALRESGGAAGAAFVPQIVIT